MLLLLACHSPSPGTITVYAGDEGLADFLATVGDPRIALVVSEDPLKDAGRSQAEVAVAVVTDSRCAECFRVDAGDVYTVTGGGALGVRYGLGALLEGFGYRFYHPAESLIPETLEPESSAWGVDEAPQIARRGLHMHTLHPIDGLYAYWTGEEDPDPIMDWAIRNRANHLQWVGLDDITEDSSRLSEWQADTAPIVARAHEEGLTVGLGIQLFGTSNLQRAFDLVDSPAEPDSMRAVMSDRIDGVVAAADWDVLNLSFGEFSGVEPEDFIEATNLAVDVIREADPDIEVPATIHVGNQEDLRVKWKGEEMLYYFLVKYADPSITPWVHSVMYYDLVEPADGAYDHEEFDEHRAFLEEKLAAGEPVGYFPETAYWVAFDDSVPAYLPLYIRSRYQDLAAFPDLQDHVLFSTGWEWGYWQNDVAALRMSWAVPDAWEDTVAWMFAPLDPALGDTVSELAEVEHTWLMDQDLAPWLAGRDQFIDLGDQLGIHSQPDRPDYAEIAEMDSTELRADLDGMAAAFSAVAPPTGTDPWSVEIADGIEVTALRARFAAALVAAAAGEAGKLEEAATLLEEGRAVVARRHANLHDDVGGRLTIRGENPTLYQYGYLYNADTLCFWEKEYAEVSNLTAGTDLDEPGCGL